MNYSYRKENTIICFNDKNYDFQTNSNLLFQCQNVAVKSCRNDSATTYTVGDRENGQ